MTEPHAEVAGARRYEVLAGLSLVAAIAYVQRAAISVPAAEIARDLDFVNLASDMGAIQSAWYLAYASMQLPSGWFADRVGSRTAVAVLAALWSLMILGSAFATDFGSLLVWWGLMGAAQAGAFPSAAKAIGQIFPETERARASGILACGMAIGGAIAPVLTALLLELFPAMPDGAGWARWRLLFAAYALPGLLWTAVFLIAVPASRLPVAPHQTGPAAAVDWTRFFRSGSLALLCAQQFFRAAGMVFFLTWFPTFLQKTRDVTMLQSGWLTTIAGLGGVAGSLSGGFASDWLYRVTGRARLSRQGIAVVGMSACSVLIVSSYFVSDVRGSIALISLGAFCATFGGISGYTVAISFGGKHVATVFSTMNMCGNIGAALFPLVAGWLVKETGNWNLMLFLFAGIMAVDAVCWAFLNPRGTLFGDADEPR
jgi:MFS family permease